MVKLERKTNLQHLHDFNFADKGHLTEIEDYMAAISIRLCNVNDNYLERVEAPSGGLSKTVHSSIYDRFKLEDITDR